MLHSPSLGCESADLSVRPLPPVPPEGGRSDIERHAACHPPLCRRHRCAQDATDGDGEVGPGDGGCGHPYAGVRRPAERTQTRNRIHKIVDGAGPRVGGVLSDLFGVNGRRILDGLVAGKGREEIIASLSKHVRRHLEAPDDALDCRLSETDRFLLHDQAGKRIAEHDAVIECGLAGHRGEIELLTTIPGIDRRAASAIPVELGPDIAVFPSARHCAAWAGLAPGNNESAGKRRSGRVRKGNQALRTVPVECAQAAARTGHCQFKGYHRALTVRRGCKRATVATAHRMLRIIHHMLSTGELQRDPDIDHEAMMVMRNAPKPSPPAERDRDGH